MKVELRSDVGKMREHNEDVCDYFLSDDLLLAVVADGMGGHKAGDVASELAIQTLREAWKKQAPHATEEAMTTWLLHTITTANERIYEQSLTNTEMRGMGTTIVCALITKSEVISAHVGDSRLYVMKENHISQVTHDHTLVNELFRQGQISEDEAKNHPQKNVVTRALGTENQCNIDVLQHELSDTDTLILCSDGLSDKLSNDDFDAVLNQDIRLEHKADQLLQLALDRGGEDNITFILIDKGANEL
ncbi:hypothetical protein DH09_04485 [Bacillaceae bacterium JMAK1]|nr:hypothetical protein DH09_04485 [Bacillaceae bacterium JMAK1]